jgi:tetratricopeptide (TPR) repeat protein
MVQGRIVDLTIQTFGAGSIDHARAMEGLAMVLYAQEKYKEAEPIFRDSMRLKEERLSHNDPELGPLLSYMSLCLERQGNFEDAVGPSRRALEIREAQLGPDHPDVAKLLNTQANLHYAQGRYEHADPLYRRALHITERRMGEKHPDVATALNNLASLLYQTRQYGAVWKSTAGLGGPHQTSELSSSVTSTSIRLIFGRIDGSQRVLEAQRKCLCQNIRIRAH